MKFSAMSPAGAYAPTTHALPSLQTGFWLLSGRPLQRCLTAVGGVTDNLLGEDATECCEHDRRQRNPRAMEPRLIIAIDAHAVRKAIDVQPGTVIAAEFA